MSLWKCREVVGAMSCDAFCAAKQNWTNIDSMNERFRGAVGVSLFGKLFVMVGHNGDYITNTAEVFDVWRKFSKIYWNAPWSYWALCCFSWRFYHRYGWNPLLWKPKQVRLPIYHNLRNLVRAQPNVVVSHERYDMSSFKGRLFQIKLFQFLGIS